MKKLIKVVILILIFIAVIYWQYIRFFNVSSDNVRMGNPYWSCVVPGEGKVEIRETYTQSSGLFFGSTHEYDRTIHILVVSGMKEKEVRKIRFKDIFPVPKYYYKETHAQIKRVVKDENGVKIIIAWEVMSDDGGIMPQILRDIPLDKGEKWEGTIEYKDIIKNILSDDIEFDEEGNYVNLSSKSPQDRELYMKKTASDN
ncbi:MAG: hypothetical protein ACOY46_17595 [Bacillota bacterium]